MPKRKAKKVQATCTLQEKNCGMTHLCDTHRAELEIQVTGTFVITSTFKNRHGDNFKGDISVVGLLPAKWFVQAIRKNGGYVHGVQREVDVSPAYIDVSKDFGIKP